MKKVLTSMFVVLFLLGSFTGCSTVRNTTTTAVTNTTSATETTRPATNENIETDSVKTPEMLVSEMFKGKNTEQKDISKIVETLPNINWKNYLNVSKDDASIVNLLAWIGELKLTDEKDITNILKASKNLDGSAAEAYSAVVGDMYLRNKIKFIKCLSSLSLEDMKKISNYVAYYAGYEEQEKYSKVESETKKLLKTPNLSPNEKLAIEALVNALKENINR